MKKHLFSAVAVILAIAASSFTVIKSSAPQTDYVFQYSGDFTEGSVETLGNWSYVSGSTLCSNDLGKACRIKVPEAQVDNPGTTPTLKTTFDIQANLGGTTRYVTSITAGTISNQADTP